ncbi:phenylalanine--tRNA ligase subunit beta, partial [Candidatus Woesearchaeota archaeon]|nr:phenylalanine--tRNA ligase subunit beta [Candidatus Woesearchaeota archaeon]
MPTITINKHEVLRNIGKLNDLELSEYLGLLGIHTETVDFDEITLEISADRPDLLSAEGISRALGLYLGKTRSKNYKTEPSKYEVIIEPSVKEVRPYTACCIAKNLELNEERIKELIDIQEKLHLTFGRNRKKAAIGIYPLERIKFPIKYLAKKPHEIKFRPLDSPYEMTAVEILQKHPKGMEYSSLLQEYKKYPIFVDANKQILSMPPIINSEKTGRVSSSTKEVFIECSGHNFNSLKQVLNVISTILIDMNAKIYTVKLRYGQKTFVTPVLNYQKMKINPDYINKILGLELKENTIRKYLEKM